jgi:uncharacterized protein (TIGR03089 family)
VRGLTDWTAGLVGPRDPAQPLLTLCDGQDRVELSGATTANWVAKSANLLVDGYGAPSRIGLLLPLHWQTVSLLLAGVATGATVVCAAEPGGLEGCEVAFVRGDRAQAALDAGVEDVLALSCTPLGMRLPDVAPGAVDYAVEVPSYADHWGGPVPGRLDVEAGDAVLPPLPELDLGPADRVLATVTPGDPVGLAELLAVLRRGASLVLVPSPQVMDLPRLLEQEGITATIGHEVPGAPFLR